MARKRYSDEDVLKLLSDNDHHCEIPYTVRPIIITKPKIICVLASIYFSHLSLNHKIHRKTVL